MRRLIWAAAAGLLLLAAPARAESRFRDDRHGFELGYASEWEVRKPSDPKIVFAATTVIDGGQVSCDARVEPYGRSSKPQMDEREFKAAFPPAKVEDGYRKGTRFDDETYTTVGGLPVLHIELTMVNSRDIRVHIAQRLLYWKGNTITLICGGAASAFEKFRPDATRFLNSFRRL